MDNAKCLAVPRAQGDIILVTEASNVGRDGTLFQWQAPEKEKFDSAISKWGTDGLNRDAILKHSYPDNKWVLVPLGHWNWKWNQARGNYSTYEQELLAGMLVLSFQSRLLESNPVVWLCDQEQVRTFQKGPPPRRLSSDADGPTGASYGSQYIIYRASRTSVRTPSAATASTTLFVLGLRS